MRVATWNVNGLRARLDFVRLWLRERRPDVVGIQELKLSDEQFPREELAADGWQTVVHAQKAWNGVAILSRERATLVRAGLPGRDGDGARLLTARVGGLSFTTAYVPNGKSTAHADFKEKLAWLDALSAYIRETHDPGRPAVLCGDFNICPAGIDSWNEEDLAGGIFHTDEERERVQALLQWGFRDLFREIHPDRAAFSWWDYRAGAFHRGHGLRLDLLFATEALRRRVRAVEIDRDWRKKHDGLTPSDHAPVWADLD
jgi:exodeoxyribonuclease-3